MTKLFFIRHGRTKWNLEGRYQGAHGDSPLLTESLHEIEELVVFLNQYDFAKIYSSPIKRARVTAQKIEAQLNQSLNIVEDEAFAEFDLGKMEGMLFKDVEKQYPKELDAFRHHAEQYDPTSIGAESFHHLFARMTPKIQEICRRYPDKNVIIVSHGAALCAEIRYLQGIPLERIRSRGGLTNTSTTILQTLDKGQHFKCLEWNKTDYLSRKLTENDTV
ncbi:phosphoglycerate mutase [Ligilactobacillus acidipiscis DSM 15836]|jgi:probable phosphoglycerate mutase|uniref:Phosphoglycerate mutase n=2 Tax=Ligilactobacillus acidipiscis TaxID=89059 RepID=A0A0R2K9F6_9LACO|nr:histidine phosphatase family protein [Ligilactobacillus acidipiscis]KRM31175.1 phosphoglycerate mutase [Ligilactobacillus acidipiscis DSM 15836]KRN86174.1 phosphoglycerate mutase [Ligilactobacillus acidipiscis]SFV40788.1 Phosphoglycerate mutase family 5 [Ligilactobacillus acidipiscis]GAW63466.1 phosphoglycerate mutase [Ligilactobacillus acidipiscis]GEN20232.1 phosphoglycerate mutase [Ligilactobacillus acidipiscis]